jgi:hypothetical protein
MPDNSAPIATSRLMTSATFCKKERSHRALNGTLKLGIGSIQFQALTANATH